MSLEKFFKSLRPVVQNAKLYRFVTGNQSADMDSVVSAISYAYFYHLKNPSEAPFLPLVNINRDELRLRRDIVLLLKAHSLNEKSLFFLDDVEQLTKGNASTLEVVLVDHCNLQGTLLTKLYEEKRLKVVGIIDHHADEEVFKDASPRIIQGNGSCSALVYNYWKAQLGEVEEELLQLLLGPLLIDTSNMTQKVEEGDVIAFADYEKVLNAGVVNLNVEGEKSSIDDFYKTLKTAKKDLTLFSFFDILRKDYKQFKFTSLSGKQVRMGFSSLGKSIAWVLKTYPTSEVTSTFDKMVDTFGLDAVVITTSYTQKENDQYTREFCYYSTLEELDNLAQLVEPLQLGLDFYKKAAVEEKLAEVNNTRKFKVYNQANIYASRKQVVPVVKAVIEEGKLV